MNDGNLTFNFSLGGANCSRVARVEEVYSKAAVASSHHGSLGGHRLHTPLDLPPGKTEVLVEYQQWFSDPEAKEPVEQRERFQHVVTVTALKNGELPAHDDAPKNTVP